MRKAAVPLDSSTDGFLLLDSSMSPIFINPAATQILTYPEDGKNPNGLAEHVARKVSTLLLSTTPGAPAIVSRFQSGKRLYRCRSFYVNAFSGGNTHPSLAVLFERPRAGAISMAQLSERFNLTLREQEVAQYILQGLTSKEIAAQMKISTNTVKAFLRLIMIKMGVSTRSGIAGKVFTSELHRGGRFDSSFL
jgi:DNA-binding CsgD family transcriptional regulator